MGDARGLHLGVVRGWRPKGVRYEAGARDLPGAMCVAGWATGPFAPSGLGSAKCAAGELSRASIQRDEPSTRSRLSASEDAGLNPRLVDRVTPGVNRLHYYGVTATEKGAPA